MKNFRKLAFAAAIAFVGVLFLLLRENELRVSAERRAADWKQKAEALTDEKGDVINELQADNLLLKQNLSDTLTRARNEIAQARAEETAARARFETEVRAKTAYILGLEERVRMDTARHSAVVNRKNASIVSLTKQVAEAEAAAADSEKEAAELAAQNLKLKRQHDRLTAVVKETLAEGRPPLD